MKYKFSHKGLYGEWYIDTETGKFIAKISKPYILHIDNMKKTSLLEQKQ